MRLIDKIKADEEINFLAGMLIRALLIFIFIVSIAFFAVTAEAAEFDVTEPCGLSAEELEGRLKGTLPEYTEDFLAAEEKHGINACFLAAVAAWESGHGTSRRAEKYNNLFGFGKIKFETVAEGIDFVAGYIAENYIAKGGKYYAGTGLSDICKNYCAGEESWTAGVKNVWKGLA